MELLVILPPFMGEVGLTPPACWWGEGRRGLPVMLVRDMRAEPLTIIHRKCLHSSRPVPGCERSLHRFRDSEARNQKPEDGSRNYPDI